MKYFYSIAALNADDIYTSLQVLQLLGMFLITYRI